MEQFYFQKQILNYVTHALYTIDKTPNSLMWKFCGSARCSSGCLQKVDSSENFQQEHYAETSLNSNSSFTVKTSHWTNNEVFH